MSIPLVISELEVGLAVSVGEHKVIGKTHKKDTQASEDGYCIEERLAN
jgi:hypothetical protein